MSRIAVVEKRPRWTPELRRQFAGEKMTVRGCRSLSDAVEWIGRSSPSLLVVDLAAGLEDCLRFLGAQLGLPEAVPVIALVSARTAELEWPLRELGVLAVVAESATGEAVAQLCRRGSEGKCLHGDFDGD